VRFVDKENHVVAFFDFVNDAFDSLFKHPTEHGACHDSAHLKLHDVGATQTCRNLFGFQFDQTCQPFDDRGLTHSRFANQHRRVCALAMAEDFYNLLNLFLAADSRWNLVCASEPVKRNAKVFQVRRQLKLLAVLLFFAFSFLNLSLNVFCHSIRVSAQAAQHLDKQPVVVR
jgi:hypothetical protein